MYVPEDQFSLAIGRGGQNSRLAAKLTGYKIDIKLVGPDGQEIEREERKPKNAIDEEKKTEEDKNEKIEKTESKDESAESTEESKEKEVEKTEEVKEEK